jgi:phosphatidate cytidylyltransferase
MAPAISPKKTWEGAVAGLVFGTAAGVAVLKLMKPEAAAWAGAGVFSALLVVAGQFGDLVESALKRWAGVKDSGRLAPEFGGMLDMIDGFLVSIPVAYLFLWYEGGRWVFSGF